MKKWFAGLLLLALAAPAARADKKPVAADEKPAAAEDFKQLQKEYQEVMQAFQKEIRAAKPEDRAELLKNNPQPKFETRFLEFAQKNPKDPAALDALLVALQLSGGPGKKDGNWAKTLGRIEADWATSEHVVKAVRMVAGSDDPAVAKLLKTVDEKNPSKKVKARVLQAKAQALETKATQAEQLKNEQVRPRAEEQLGKERVEKLIADGEKAAKDLAEIKKTLADKYADVVPVLEVGKPAPELVSADLKGNKVKLSDLKGKVVVLDIWATWCGPCKAMIPHEREMVKKLKDKPFVLVSISADEKRETVEKFIEQEPMPWTHWWNGASGGIIEEWNVRYFPTIYILDHKGVIRFKDLRGEKMEEAVEKLLGEVGAKGDKK